MRASEWPIVGLFVGVIMVRIDWVGYGLLITVHASDEHVHMRIRRDVRCPMSMSNRTNNWRPISNYDFFIQCIHIIFIYFNMYDIGM